MLKSRALFRILPELLLSVHGRLFFSGLSPKGPDALANPYVRVGVILGVFFAVFVLARLALFLVYRDVFADLSFGQIIWSFVYGLRFDASTVALFLGLPMVLMLLPFKATRSKFWQAIWVWWAYIVLLLMVFMLAADLVYFGFVRRHVGAEVAMFADDPALMSDIILSEHWFALSIFVLFAVLLAWAWRRLITHAVTPARHGLGRVLITLVLFFGFAMAARGGLQYKPIGVGDAFAGGSASSGYLALNGAFAIQHALISDKPTKAAFFPWDEAVKSVQQQVSAPGDGFADENFPLLRKPALDAAAAVSAKPNIVVLMLESWDAVHIDVMRTQMGLPPLGVTPNFDALSREGMLYTQFYAAGQRSMDGLAAMLASMPTLPGMPHIGKGLEQSRLSFIGQLAKAQDYQTIFLQSSNRGSFHIDSIAAQAGFDTYQGAEDIPPAHAKGDVQASSEWGVWDHDTFQQANTLFEQAKKPFLGFLFTSTTHNPWRVPNPRWRKFEETDERSRYLNTVYYSDWALGEFFKAAKASGYYNNTIFLITGDHISRFDVNGDDERSRFHVPLLVVGGGVKPGIETRIGGQLDVMPTVIDLGKWTSTYAGLGRSLLAPVDLATGGAFSVNGNILQRIEASGWVMHDLSRRMGEKTFVPGADLAGIEKRLLSTYQVTNTLLLENRIAR